MENDKELDKQLNTIIKMNPTKYKFWTEKEVYILKKLWGKVPRRVVAKTLGKSFDAVDRKSRGLGLTSQRQKV